MPLIIAICDDEENQIKELRRLLDEWSANKPIALVIDEYISAENFLFSYPDNPCDLLLLDIEMNGINGMELAKKLRGSGDMLPIVFITGYSDYISEGYDVEALHYLLKPIVKEKLFGVLDKYVEKNSATADELLIETTSGVTHISADIITYIEAFGRKTHVHLSDGTIIDCTMSISSFSGKPLKGFVSCHRSYIVNLRFVRSIGKANISIDSGDILPLSRRLFKEVNEKFIQLYTKG